MFKVFSPKFVNPHLEEYDIQASSHRFIYEADILEQLQLRETKMIKNLSGLSYHFRYSTPVHTVIKTILLYTVGGRLILPLSDPWIVGGLFFP